MVKNDNFKPHLAPNEQVTLDLIPNIKDKFTSKKLDGIRTLPQKGGLLSRSLKPIRNTILNERFSKIVELATNNNCIFDGEIYGHNYTFDQIKSYVMRETHESVPEDIKFYCFDCYFIDEPELPFFSRLNKLHLLLESNQIDSLILVEHKPLYEINLIQTYYESVLDEGYEGVMIKDRNSKYKFGRSTIKEGVFFKYKPFETTDAIVFDVFERTSARVGSEKKINELGYSVTSKKKDDRVGNGMIGGFWVTVPDHPEYGEFKVTVKEGNEELWKQMWDEKDNYIGKYIEFKFMGIGMNKAPRLPKYIRLRDDKED